MTPNERLARSLRDRDDRERALEGQTTWETLPACSWSVFLHELWEELCLECQSPEGPGSILSAWQERVLWMRVLEESPQGGLLLNLPAAARLAGDAWELVQAYRLGDELWNPPLAWDEDTRAFLNWAGAFRSFCEAEKLIDRASLEATLQQALEVGQLSRALLPSLVDLVGFVDLSPAQRGLLTGMEEAGVQVRYSDPPEETATSDWCRVVLEDSENEMRAAAEWVRAALEGTPGKVPDSIGVVVPDLTANQAQLQRIFDEVLQPESLLPCDSPAPRPYNLSLGRPLAQWPIVADALSLLGLGSWPSPLPQWGALFHSPFVGEAESERPRRALLEARLLRDGAYRIPLSRLLRAADEVDGEGQPRPHHSPNLGLRLGRMKDRLEQAPKRQSPSLWSSHFWSMLEVLGWPGERTLSSAEQQTAARWRELLAQLGSLDRIRPLVSRHEAWLLLRRMAEETIFQPELRSARRVEVLGYLEAAGLTFDQLWVLGMHDGAWPPSARPNPYLPLSLQRRLEIPHSSPERELDFARRVTRQLLQGAPTGVVSSPTQAGDQHLRPSLLVETLPERDPHDLPRHPASSLSGLYRQSGEVEELIDPGPPPVADDEVSRGGTSIFKLQAACPFRAFASLRLAARPLETADDGLDAAQRGTLLHTALEALWKEARSQENWREASLEKRETWIEAAAQEGLRGLTRKRPDVLRGTFLDLEHQRLTQMLHDWMELELERPPFEVIATEQEVQLEFANLQLRATIDRVDRLRSGELAILDYKTGKVSHKDWATDRPAEPQLPLYCVATPNPVQAVAFGRVRSGEMAFDGIGQRDGLLPGVHASEQAGDRLMNWEERLANWRETLESLARDFKAGKAAVDPVQGPRTCTYCGLQILCRIAEQES